MRTVVLLIVAGAGALFADLGSSLMAPNEAAVANEILSLSEDGHRPSQFTVARLSKNLCTALRARPLSRPQVSRLAAAIQAVMESAGTGTGRFKAAIGHAQNALLSLGASPAATRDAVASLTQLGKEVRGPDDTPLQQD
jgi:hypothetical protein